MRLIMDSVQEIDAKVLLSNLTFCVFDLETTGGNHLQDKIIEIGLVKIKNLKIIDQKKYLIQPDIKVPDFIQKLTAISAKDLENAPRIEAVVHDVLDFMGDSILVAHNIAFDIPFFNSVLRRMQLPELSNNGLCTNLMTKYLIPNLLNTNLHYMSKLFSIQLKKAHRALDDARASAELLLCYFDIFINKKITKLNHLYYPRNKYELDRANFKNKGPQTALKIIELARKIKTPFLITIKGKEGLLLYSMPFSDLNSKIISTKDNNSFLDHLEMKLSELPFENVTINLYGSFFEVLVNFTQSLPKMMSNYREEISKLIKKYYFKNLAPAPLITHDFIFSNHLVPEQFIIHPLQGLSPKNCLVFRFPGHEKKLIQFLNSKISRLQNKKVTPRPDSDEFIYDYLRLAQTQNKDILFLDKDCLKMGPDHLFSKFEQFLKLNPNAFNYPQNYI